VLEVTINGKTVEAVIGKRGEFYIENLKPGKFPAKITLEDKQCSFEIAVPGSREMIVNIGDISCEMD
jgi:outer membrane usher protein